MPNAKRTKTGKYSISVYDYVDFEGKQHYKRFTADTRKEVELLAATWKKDKTINRTDLKSVAVGLEQFIVSREPVLSPSTIRSYRTMQKILQQEYNFFMSKSVNSVTEYDMQCLVSDLSRKRSPKTVKNYTTLLMSISERFKAFKIVTPTIPQYEANIPTERQIMTLLDACKGTEIEVPIMLGCFCMMRRGEICALKMKDVDFERKTIHIRESYVKDQDNLWSRKSPKTKKSDRTIKVPDFVLEKIKQKGKITYLLPDQLTGRFERKLQKLGLPIFRFHDLRHYCCSVFIHNNIGLSYIQQYGGWSNSQVLLKTYQHVMRDKEDEIYKQMNDYFSSNYENHNFTHNSETLYP